MSSGSRVELVADDRLGRRVLGREPHGAAALLRQQAGRDPDTVRVGIACAFVDDLQRHRVELDVGGARAGSDAGEPTRLREVGRERTGALRFVALERLRLQGKQQALRLGRRVDELRRRVVAEIGTHRGPVQKDLDFAHREVLGVPDTRQHQQLRRVVGTGGEDHLALGVELLRRAELGGFDTDGAVALEQDPVRLHVGHHVEVRPLGGRVEVGDRGRGPHPLPLGHLVHPDAVLLTVVEVVVASETQPRRRPRRTRGRCGSASAPR